MRLRKATLVCLGVALLSIVAVLYSGPEKKSRHDPLDVVRAYLKATYAHDYREAYRHIASSDRAVWDEASYLSHHASLSGFALELARGLAEMMEIWPVERSEQADRVHYRVGYRVPAAETLASRLFGWESQKLEELSGAEQKRLREELAKTSSNTKSIMIEGQEFFDLILEQGNWKIFFDWRSATPVELKAHADSPDAIDARFVTSKLLVRRDAPFQVELKIKNRGNSDVLARVIHHIEPPEMIDYIDMIMCGGLVPFALRAGEEREISSAYLLRDGARVPLSITYKFTVEPFSSS